MFTSGTILLRRSSLILFKGLNKIAEIIEPGIERNLCNRIVCRKQLITGTFYSVIIEIVDWSPVCHLMEEAAEVFG